MVVRLWFGLTECCSAPYSTVLRVARAVERRSNPCSQPQCAVSVLRVAVFVLRCACIGACQAEAANPQCHLVLVEDPAEVMDELEAQGDSLQVSQGSITRVRVEGLGSHLNHKPSVEHKLQWHATVLLHHLRCLVLCRSCHVASVKFACWAVPNTPANLDPAVVTKG
jgi:hypothetical protein